MEHQRQLAQIAGKIDGFFYRYAPLNLARAAVGARRWLLPFLGLRVGVRELQGKGTSGDALVMLCVGEERRMRYVTDLVYAEQPVRRGVARVFPWELRRRLAALDHHADLICARVDAITGGFVFPRDYFTVPEWIASRLTLSELPLDLARISHSVGSDLRRVRREGFSPVISHDWDDLELFYRTMYVPYVVWRFGSSALLHGFDHLRYLFARGGLLFVKWQGQYVAGELYEVDGDTVYSHVLGVKDGDYDYVQMGASAALTCFMMSWAREQGYSQVHFGGTRPFLDDGIFQKKRKWHPRVEQHRRAFYDLKLKVCNLSPGVRSFLATNPFIFRDEGDLSALVFVDQTVGRDTGAGEGKREDRCVSLPVPAGFDKVHHSYKNYWTPGLRRLYVISPGGFEDGADQGDWVSLLPGVVLIDGGGARSHPRVFGASPDAIPPALLSLVQCRIDPSPSSSGTFSLTRTSLW